MKKLVLGIIIAMFIIPAAAQASGYLHVGEAQLQSAKLGIALAKAEHAKGYVVSSCARVSASKVGCKITLVGIVSTPAETCTAKTSVIKKSDGLIAAKTYDGICVEAH